MRSWRKRERERERKVINKLKYENFRVNESRECQASVAQQDKTTMNHGRGLE